MKMGTKNKNKGRQANGDTDGKKKRSRQTTLFATMKRTKTATGGGGDGDESSTRPLYQIYCDLDGVLVDFDAGVRQVLGNGSDGPTVTADSVHPGVLWGAIARTPHFYRTLPWTADGPTLWGAIRPLRPHILTGCPQPSSNTNYALDKFEWCKRELCVEVRWVHKQGQQRNGGRAEFAKPKAQQSSSTASAAKKSVLDHSVGSGIGGGAGGICQVITCWSSNKHRESRPGRVLIDDRKKLKRDWEASGGIFVHHTSTTATLQRLRKLGVLPKQDDDEEEEEQGTDEVLAVAVAAATASAAATRSTKDDRNEEANMWKEEDAVVSSIATTGDDDAQE
jgi:hypothetical protein